MKALAMIFFLLPSVALANMTQTESHGFWGVYSGTVALNNRGGSARSCMIGTHVGNDKAVLVQYIAGDQFVRLRLFNDAWAVGAQESGRIVVAIGSRTWDATIRRDGARNIVMAAIGRSVLDEWETAFRTSTIMSIRFATGNEPVWTVSLNGSNAATTSFGRCIRGLSPPTPFSTPSPMSDEENTSLPVSRGRERRT